MPYRVPIAAGLLLFAVAGVCADEPLEPLERRVAALGTLSGIALHCQYTEEVRRTKAAVVQYAPATRRIGARFESATNESFLAAANEGKPCPPAEALAWEVDAAIKALQKAAAGNAP